MLQHRQKEVVGQEAKGEVPPKSTQDRKQSINKNVRTLGVPGNMLSH